MAVVNLPVCFVGRVYAYFFLMRTVGLYGRELVLENYVFTKSRKETFVSQSHTHALIRFPSSTEEVWENTHRI